MTVNHDDEHHPPPGQRPGARHAGPGAHGDGPHRSHAGGHGGHGADGGGHQGPREKHAGHDPEAFRRKFWVCLILTIPVILTSHLVMDWLNYSLDFPGISLVGPVLGSIVFFYGGWPFLVGAVREVRDRAPGMMLLIGLAITVAYLASAATSLGVFDLDFWWEMSALVTIMLLGHWQEMKAIGQARGALAALAELLPDDAERISADGAVQRVKVSELRVKDVVLVRPGSRVPADGHVTDGRADVDESMITGESRPVPRGVGERVVAGSVATDSAIRVQIDAVGEDTALAGIQRLVAEAQAAGGRAQDLADRFAALLFYVATAVAIISLVVWAAIGNLDQAVVRTITVLVISCPHALGLAIPLVIALSTSLAASNGILIKNRLALERMRHVDVVLFDKTGTLTKGEHTVTGVAGAGGTSEDEVLRLAAGVEAESEHPLARAIVKAAKGHRQPATATDFQSLPGRGVQASIDGTRYAVGGPALLREQQIQVPDDLARAADNWSRRGASVLNLVKLDRTPQVLGTIALEDAARPEARDAIQQLRELGVQKIAMITGDARTVAEAVAADLGFRHGVDEIFAEVLPADKDDKVSDLQSRGLTVAMVGDGVNDAPALARADIGIAIGAGTDVAIESAGVILASSDPRGVASTVRLSKASYRKMIQNLGWAAGYNVIAIPAAAGAFAWAGFALSPAAAAVLMSASTIVVALNAQTLRRVQLAPEQR
ncbi:heavy metal translocating P-type ATPase [Micromonospora thermarum]|uniref:Heavy metal translocating P-type ATPase n=1 Tax=Micromonospora thermarum TaxID=2720024 RepID=A0ABX0ZCV6_9ACTN|nr:heavy metal translocating P-type ATPase [Micromonospora thermarum]NJP35756.1 heavy metal translocating P-type ATPase [Micromonospora thermarum]